MLSCPAVTGSAMLRRLATGALLLAAASGCEQQEAEPLSKSVPTGLAVFAATTAALWWLVRRSLRRLARPMAGPLAPLRFPRLTVALLVGPVLIPGVVLAAMACHEVALGFRYEKTSALSYDDTVGLSVFVAGFVLVLVAVAGGLAVSAQSRKTSSRFTARAVVASVVLALFAFGVGLVWLPALVLMFVETDASASSGPSPRSVSKIGPVNPAPQ